MTSTKQLVVVSAGLSQPSSTRLLADRLASATQRALAADGVDLQVDVIELRDLAHQLTDHLLTGFPAAGLRTALELVSRADGVIAVTPIFSASYSGLFKSFFDVLEPGVMDGTPVLMAATGGTERHSLALEFALRPLFAHLRAAPVPTAVYAATHDWGAAGDGQLTTRIERAAAELAGSIARHAPATTDDPYDIPVPFEQLLFDGQRQSA
ncbi:FMN reductase [Microlunatus panaciterrae]|uniref:FMN reductase n=1 Tax=Microlunatus panaciterrae TaxID=400768 RepID=A0ABS2RHJ9_9ACTN|nr:FMN reductase [Microlunatus panaciterrae]MBM7798027.1 FMN reductase [Microlunatus panaciterrae]